jgi:outer membrane protein assembly factor BamB
MASGFAFAADWPQWGGATRNFQVDTKGLADTWPEAGPPRLWTKPLGDGYAGIAAVKNRLYMMYRADDREHVVALDAETGGLVWHFDYAAPFLDGTNVTPGPGPHATPLVVDGRVCTVGVTGLLHCLDAASGKVLWMHDIIGELGGTKLFRGCSPSLIAYKQTVLAAVGGSGHAVVAFRLEDGTPKWQKQDFRISHASPLLISHDGQDQLVVLADQVIAGVDPSDGELLWQHAHPISGGHIASMPVWGADGRLFFSCAYSGGSRCLQLAREGDRTNVGELWYNNKMRVHHSNAVRVGGYVYASSGDFGPKVFTAIDVASGKIAWRERGLGRCSCVYADGKLIALQEDGQLMLAKISPAELQILSKAALFDGRAWTPPTLVGKRLYIRNRTDVMAYELP